MAQARTAVTSRARRAVLADVSSLERGDALRSSQPFIPPDMDQARFRSIMSCLPTGVTVVTCLDCAGRPVGLTANAVASVSLYPPQLLVCLQSAKYTLSAIRDTKRFAVNFLSGSQAHLADRFARRSADKFSGLAWDMGSHLNVPLLRGALAHAECEVTRMVPSGDHCIVVGSVMAGSFSKGDPLIYYARRYASWVDAATSSS